MVNTMPNLGIIGGGQLGSLLASAARKLNIKTVVITDDKDAPAKNFCDDLIFAQYDDLTKIKEFTNKVDVITFEFENIPFETLNQILKIKPIFPNPSINKIVQNRVSEKQFVNSLGIKTTLFKPITNKEHIVNLDDYLPGILKTNTMGYDGKGQYVIKDQSEIENLNINLNQEYILEKKIELEKEISVIITRFQNGEISMYEPIENLHVDQILNKSIIPAKITKEIFDKAQYQAKLIAEKLNYVGTMCVEYFIDKKNNLLVNEIAPRVHNSGHLTLNAYNISQFENHIRAVCDLEKIKLNKTYNAEMKNILGFEIEKYRKTKFSNDEFFYDYLKAEAKEKRKMGHITRVSKI